VAKARAAVAVKKIVEVKNNPRTLVVPALDHRRTAAVLDLKKYLKGRRDSLRPFFAF